MSVWVVGCVELLKPNASAEEVLERALRLSGCRVGNLQQKHPLQEKQVNLLTNKGGLGQVIEQTIYPSNLNLPGPDIPSLGLEIKSLPVSAQGRPLSSLFVCVAPRCEPPDFEASLPASKLRHVLFVPYHQAPGVLLKDAQIGSAFLWRPTNLLWQALRSDWEELSLALRLGEQRELSAHYGTLLQIRPKARNNQDCRAFLSSDGYNVEAKRCGYYLRRTALCTFFDAAHTP